MNQNWNVNKYFTPTEPPQRWNLRKAFMETHKNKYPEDRVVSLAQIFCNMEFLGSSYSPNLMALVQHLANQVEAIRTYRANKMLKMMESDAVPLKDAVPVEDAVPIEVAVPVEVAVPAENAVPEENAVQIENAVQVENTVPEEDVVPVPKVNIRHDWYQTEATVVVTILARNIHEIHVDYTDTTLSVDLKVPCQGDYKLRLNLAHKIVPEKSSFRVMSTKVEIKLFKLDGLQWNTLEGDASQKLLTVAPKDVIVCTGPPRYPSSNRVQRNWDAIERDIIREFADLEQPAKGPEGVNTLFQQIYGEGNDEVKKAMNKSFLESGGTVLSTNWKEISKDKVQIKPPDGLEWKKWD